MSESNELPNRNTYLKRSERADRYRSRPEFLEYLEGIRSAIQFGRGGHGADRSVAQIVLDFVAGTELTQETIRRVYAGEVFPKVSTFDRILSHSRLPLAEKADLKDRYRGLRNGVRKNLAKSSV